MTNDIYGEKLSILKCTDCRDGYLIVKSSGKGGRFLGCTNYKKDRTGCGKTVSMKDYYKKMGYDWSEEMKAESPDPESAGQGRCPSERDRAAGPKPAAVKPAADGDRAKNWEQEMLDHAGGMAHSADQFPKYKGYSVFHLAETVLQGLVQISDKHFFGVSVLTSVLWGFKTEQIRRHGLDRVPQYGSLSFFSREEVTVIIYWLIEKKYMIQTKGKYPVLHITHMGLTYREQLTPRNMKSLAERLYADQEKEG